MREKNRLKVNEKNSYPQTLKVEQGRVSHKFRFYPD